LGFTIDPWIKSDLSKDVFRETISTIFPPEFRDEIFRIVSFKFICEIHFMIIKIEKIGEDLVRVTASNREDISQ